MRGCRLLVLQCGKRDKHWQLFALEPCKPSRQAPDVSLRKALLCRHRFQTRHLQVPPLPFCRTLLCRPDLVKIPGLCVD